MSFSRTVQQTDRLGATAPNIIVRFIIHHIHREDERRFRGDEGKYTDAFQGHISPIILRPYDAQNVT